MIIKSTPSSNGILKSKQIKETHPIVSLYENLLFHRGIHVKPMTELSFNICYSRYRQLGGRNKFDYK